MGFRAIENRRIRPERKDIGKELRSGAATQNGEEVVINRTLPAGVVATPVYDRTVLSMLIRVDINIQLLASRVRPSALPSARSS